MNYAEQCRIWAISERGQAPKLAALLDAAAGLYSEMERYTPLIARLYMMDTEAWADCADRFGIATPNAFYNAVEKADAVARGAE